MSDTAEPSLTKEKTKRIEYFWCVEIDCEKPVILYFFNQQNFNQLVDLLPDLKFTKDQVYWEKIMLSSKDKLEIYELI